MLFLLQNSTSPTPPPSSAPIGPTINPLGQLYGTDAYITVNGVDLGSTVGAISINWSIDQYYPNFFQSRGNLAGTGKVTKGEFSIKVMLAEWQYARLSLIAGSLGLGSDANSERIGGGVLGAVTEVSNVIITGCARNDGRVFFALIPSASIELGNIELNEDKETTLEVTFHGLFTYSTPKNLPGSIIFSS